LEKFEWTIRVAFVITVVIAALSIFFAAVGVPGSYESVSEQCSLGSPCVSTQQAGTSFTRTPETAIALFAATAVAIGLVKKSNALSWLGTALLLGFSFGALFSVGLLYLPFGIALLVLLPVIHARRRLPFPS
jgi:hypothetical protein